MIYIASRYKANEKLNSEIYQRLLQNNIQPYLPKKLNKDAHAGDVEEQRLVSAELYKAIANCSDFLLVYPCGADCFTELGYAINNKILNSSCNIYVLNLNDDGVLEKSAMIYPYIDGMFYNIGELVDGLKDKI